MHLPTAFLPLLAPSILITLSSSTLASIVDPDPDVGVGYFPITRTLGNTTVTAVSPCEPGMNTCLQYCKTINKGDTLYGDCNSDCEDDLCEFGSVREPIVHEGRVTTFARFARLASEARRKDLVANMPVDNDIGVAFSDCTDTCNSFANVALKLGLPIVPGFVANLAARTMCNYVCGQLGGATVDQQNQTQALNINSLEPDIPTWYIQGYNDPDCTERNDLSVSSASTEDCVAMARTPYWTFIGGSWNPLHQPYELAWAMQTSSPTAQHLCSSRNPITDARCYEDLGVLNYQVIKSVTNSVESPATDLKSEL